MKRVILSAFAGVLLFSTLRWIGPAYTALARQAQTSPGSSDVARFDVVSVKPWSGSAPAGVPTGAIRFLPGGRLNAPGATLTNLIQRAYEVRYDQLIGVPDWMKSERYDIEATAAAAAPTAQMRLMLQSLLEDQFKLKAHRETRELPVFELILVKDDVKLRNSAKGNCKPGDAGTAFALGNSDFTPCGNIITRAGPDGSRMDGGNLSIAALASDLTAQFRQPVIDRTGYTGTFDLHLRFTPEMRLSADSTDPTIYTALEEQLGLKLNSTKAPVEVFVIDSAQRPKPN